MRLAVGYFDGVHLGHRAILRGADRALTFSSHPLTVLAPEKAPRLIMSLEERLSAIGCPVELLHFTPELAAMSPDEFAARHLKGCVVSCGANWRFGRAGAGNAAWLRAHGYAVEVAPFVECAGAPISSTRIRAALGRGDIAAANAMLGHPFVISGRIVRGKGEGRALGCPTVNVEPRSDMPELPCGVYEVEVAGVRAIANYGHAPTFRERRWPAPVLEVHFFSDVPDAADRAAVLRFIRPERKFDSPEDLKRQIALDCASLHCFDFPRTRGVSPRPLSREKAKVEGPRPSLGEDEVPRRTVELFHPSPSTFALLSTSQTSQTSQSFIMSFFKQYDMRGTYGVDFDLDLIRRVGRALPQVVKGTRWLVGRDCRVTSADVREALVEGLVEAGVEVTDLGLCTTPMVYFFTAENGFDGSVMITASHNPPGDNGLKVSKKTALPVGYANGLDEVERIVKMENFSNRTPYPGRLAPRIAPASQLASLGGYPAAIFPVPGASRPGIRRFDDSDDSTNRKIYLNWMKARRPDLSGLRFAVDCSNGMACLLAKELFPQAVIINDTLDGTFPSHSPNPLKPEAREQVAALVRERHLDCGVLFDGDADRCIFVDERGEFVQPDYLIPIVARATIKNFSNRRIVESTSALSPLVIHDVRTSRGVIEELRRMGCEPVMVPVGHAFAKPILRKVGAVCGGELAGHYYFSEFHGCDSGVLAAMRILGEAGVAKRSGGCFSGMVGPIRGVYANSGEINFRVGEKDMAIARCLEVMGERFPREVSRSEMDGVRVEFDEGWVSIRKSNTEPYLRLTVERAGDVGEWVRLLGGVIEG